MAAVQKFIVHKAAMNRLLRGIDGPVGQYIDRKGSLVVAEAFQHATAAGFRPFGRIANHPPGPYMRTTNLSRLIRKFGPSRGPNGELQVRIGSTAKRRGYPYPRSQELGGVSPTGKPYIYPFLKPGLQKIYPRVR